VRRRGSSTGGGEACVFTHQSRECCEHWDRTPYRSLGTRGLHGTGSVNRAYLMHLYTAAVNIKQLGYWISSSLAATSLFAHAFNARRPTIPPYTQIAPISRQTSIMITMTIFSCTMMLSRKYLVYKGKVLLGSIGVGYSWLYLRWMTSGFEPNNEEVINC